MRRRVIILAFLIGLLVPAALVSAQQWNFPDRKAIVLDVCPHVLLNSFRFENTIDGGISRHTFHYRWKNAGDKPVLAFEIVTLKYDPFDEPMRGSLTIITGRNSADYSPLGPGEESGNGTSGYGHVHVLTAIAYVRTVRFTDGSIWRSDPEEVLAEIQKRAPQIKDAGSLVPQNRE